MTELDRLPPDQRAVLSLVLDRGKSYAEVAAMLSISEETVRERAHAALDALAHTSASTGANPASAGAPASSSGIAAIPSSGSTTSPGSSDSHDSPASGGADPATSRSRASAPVSPGNAGATASLGGIAARARSSSRLGGALLLGGIVVVVVVAAILLTSGDKGGSTTTPTSPAPASTQPTSTTGNGTARIDKKLTLTATEPESSAVGEAYVLSDGSRRAFYVAAQHLPPSNGFFYAVWLYNSPSNSAPLGRAPTVGSNGRLEGGGPLPTNAADYAKIVVTRETSTHARHPGAIVLSGDFSLH